MREHGRGKRWLLLRRWKTVRGSKRAELQALFAANRRLFKAYVLREQLDRLWTYKTREGVFNFLIGWFKALRWQRLPEMERLGDFLFKHINGIVAYCDHAVRFGVVESINTTIKAVLRRARGMRDEEMLLLKLKWATAHPIRSARDLVRFLTAQSLYQIGEDRQSYMLQVTSSKFRGSAKPRRDYADWGGLRRDEYAQIPRITERQRHRHVETYVDSLFNNRGGNDAARCALVLKRLPRKRLNLHFLDRLGVPNVLKRQAPKTQRS